MSGYILDRFCDRKLLNWIPFLLGVMSYSLYQTVKHL